MTVEEISRRAKEKFIKAKKEFKDGDFFKIATKGATLAIGCFKSIDSDSYGVEIYCYFIYLLLCNSTDINLSFKINFDEMDFIKASPRETMFAVDKLKNRGNYYDRRARKVKVIGKQV